MPCPVNFPHPRMNAAYAVHPIPNAMPKDLKCHSLSMPKRQLSLPSRKRVLIRYNAECAWLSKIEFEYNTLKRTRNARCSATSRGSSEGRGQDPGRSDRVRQMRRGEFRGLMWVPTWRLGLGHLRHRREWKRRSLDAMLGKTKILIER